MSLLMGRDLAVALDIHLGGAPDEATPPSPGKSPKRNSATAELEGSMTPPGPARGTTTEIGVNRG